MTHTHTPSSSKSGEREANMNAKAWTTKLLLAALLVLTVGVPCAVADEQKPPEMSAGVKLLGHLEEVEKPPEGWFKPDPNLENEPYDAEAQLAIYGGKHMNKTAQVPVELGIRLYDRGAYTPRP